MPSALFLFVSFFCHAGDGSQGLTYARQVSYHKAILPALFLSFVFYVHFIYLYFCLICVCLSVYLSVCVCVCLCKRWGCGVSCHSLLFSFGTGYFLEPGTHGTSPSPTCLQGQHLVAYMTARIHSLLLMTEGRCSINRRAVPPAPFSSRSFVTSSFFSHGSVWKMKKDKSTAF